MKKTGIYRIYNSINDKSYIGQALDIETRWKGHLRELRNNVHNNSLLQRDFNCYGEDKFDFSIITQCKDIELNALEKLYIETYNSTYTGYNIADGNKNINKKYKEKLLENKNKSEGIIKSKNDTREVISRNTIEEIKKPRMKIAKYKILGSTTSNNYKDEMKKVLKDNLKVRVIDNKTFRINGDFFEEYLKVESLKKYINTYLVNNSTKYIGCNIEIYAMLWEVLGELVGEKYLSLVSIDRNTIKIKGLGGEQYISYNKFGDEYHMMKIQSTSYSHKECVLVRKELVRDNVDIYAYKNINSKIEYSGVACPIIKGLFALRRYIKENYQVYYKEALLNINDIIRFFITETNRYSFNGKLIGIVDNKYIIVKRTIGEKYVVIDLSDSYCDINLMIFIVDNYNEFIDIKFKSNTEIQFDNEIYT